MSIWFVVGCLSVIAAVYLRAFVNRFNKMKAEYDCIRVERDKTLAEFQYLRGQTLEAERETFFLARHCRATFQVFGEQMPESVRSRQVLTIAQAFPYVCPDPSGSYDASYKAEIIAHVQAIAVEYQVNLPPLERRALFALCMMDLLTAISFPACEGVLNNWRDSTQRAFPCGTA